MKTIKRDLVSTFLILAMALFPWMLPEKSKAQAKPQWVVPVICGCLVIGIGAWVTYEMIQVCKKIPDPKPGDQPDPPPPPNQPQFFTPSSTNTPSVTMRLNDSGGVATWDASGYGWTDPVSGDPVTAVMLTTVQSTSDFHAWANEVGIVGYFSQAGAVLVFSRTGTPICTNYLAAGATNVLNLNAGGVLPPSKFYRLAAP